MERMKILIGYDGSACAEAALADLKCAGLPRKAEVFVLSVSAELIPAPASIGGVTTPFPEAEFKAEQEALMLARSARDVVKTLFPEWHVRAEAATGSPAGVLIGKADEWQPDLIVVGSHGRSGFGRMFFGSVSQKVLHEARCSVRVARGAGRNAGEPVRIVVGVDGSEGARAAVKAVTTRHWPKGSEVRVVAALGTFPPTIFPPTASEHMPAEVVEWVEAENRKIREAVEAAVRRLEGVGLVAEAVIREGDPAFFPLGTQLPPAALSSRPVIREGDPQRLLCELAEEWGTDSIFVGAKGMGRIERMLIGSVSSAVAANAHCSVEVVRQPERKR
ncbi:MAG TPA: universal stress protein [Blastocatellia bacterium]|nr:universal stress protein [Blastocatellia bacterium]